MINPPSGTVTFLYTDIEGSTRLAQKYVDSYNKLLEKHDVILRTSIENNNGFVFRTVGDGFCASFVNVEDAVKAAINAQKKLIKEDHGKFEVKVRMGIHTGTAEYHDNDYIGYMTLSRVNRVMSTASGGQIVASNDSFLAANDRVSSDINFRDLGERRLKDMIRPIRLFQIQSPGLPSDFPPLKTLDARPNNLPVQLTSFVGRETDLEKTKVLLNQNHLLTLVGTGGVGKTRLSLQLAAELIDEFENGVWFIDQTMITDESLLTEKILSTLNIKEEPKVSVRDTLMNNLKNKEMLLIFDNCEHLINASSKLIEDLLTNCPNLKILATSREALKCVGEQTYRVDSLSAPEKISITSAKKLSQYEAVKLFIERALAVNPGFKVTNENAPALAEICHKLEGIPLAIELAAARTNILSLEKIKDRLSNRFQLLTGGKRTAIPKQQTLKALIDWSYDLLSECEKLLFLRVSIFRKGWSLEAAESICSDEKLRSDEVLDLLGQLFDKSLITYSKEQDRYDILESLRQYAEERFQQSGEKPLIKDKHQKYFVTLATGYNSSRNQTSQAARLNLIEQDHYNFQISLYNFIEECKFSEALNLAFLLARFLEIKGYYTEGLRWFSDILKFKESLSLAERAKALQWTGIFEWIKGNFARSKEFLEECLSIRTELGDKEGIANSLSNLGLVAFDMNDFAKAVEYHEKGMKLFDEFNDKALLADARLNYASALVKFGNLEKAGEVWEQSLNAYRELNDKRGIAMVSNNLGTLAMYNSDYKKSLKLFEEALKIEKEVDDRRGMAMTLNNIGTISGFNDNLKKGEQAIEESIIIHREIDDPSGLANALCNLGFIKYELGKHDASLKLHRESVQIRNAIGDNLGIMYSLLGVAETIANENPAVATALIGFIESNTNSLELIAEDEIKAKYERLIGNLRLLNSKDDFEKYFQQGKNIDLAKAVEIGIA